MAQIIQEELTTEQIITKNMHNVAYAIENLNDKKLFYKLLETYSNHLLEIIEEAKEPKMLIPNNLK